MIDEWELWATANEVIRQHGDQAPGFAVRRQIELAEAGDLEGSLTWLQIGLKIIELQRERSSSEPLH